MHLGINFLVCELDIRVCVQATSVYINDHHASFYTDEQTYYENPRGLLQSGKKLINTKRQWKGKGSKRGQEEENKMTTTGKEQVLFYDTL